MRTFDVSVTYYNWATGEVMGIDSFIVDVLNEDEAERCVSNMLWIEGAKFSIDKVVDVTAVYSGEIVG
ncbi:MAG: hypothetical protein J6T99_07115 [Oscillospiraceae bacterium]|nr:hypothetical protein [Oscillospiraceae bacterium]